MARFGRDFVRAATQPAYLQGLFTAAQQVGAAPRRRREEEKLEQQKQALAAINTNSPAGLLQLAGFYRSQGDIENAVKYEEAARTLQGQVDEQARLVAFQEKVASAAEGAGLKDQAATARATQDMDELRAISNDVRDFQIEQLPLDNPQVIKARLRMAGFTPAQITAMGTISAEDADALLKGRTGNLEAWQDTEGNIRAVNVNDFGLVYDDQTQKYVRASQLGLVQKAPNKVQQIVDTSLQVGAEAMAEANVEGFIKLHEKATNARDQIAILDRQTARLEGGMPTGLLATTELTLRRIGEAIGMPYDPQVTNAENYISEASKIVAEQIKDFGSGTGLSDADREYAKIGAGADITQQQEALLNLIKIRRRAMAETVKLYNTVRASTAKRLGENNMTVYMPITLQDEPKEAEAELPPGFEMDQ